MTRQELYFSVSGMVPRPQGSKRHVGGGRLIEASPDLKPWREAIANAVFQAWEETGDSSPFTEAVEVQATFYLPRPKTVKRLLPAVMPDLDKLQRSLGDGLSINCQALADDSLIVKWDARKLYAEDPSQVGVRVAIRTITPAEIIVTIPR
jgi:crossover junction endodeoxyribonuclease RusA